MRETNVGKYGKRRPTRRMRYVMWRHGAGTTSGHRDRRILVGFLDNLVIIRRMMKSEMRRRYRRGNVRVPRQLKQGKRQIIRRGRVSCRLPRTRNDTNKSSVMRRIGSLPCRRSRVGFRRLINMLFMIRTFKTIRRNTKRRRRRQCTNAYRDRRRVASGKFIESRRVICMSGRGSDGNLSNIGNYISFNRDISPLYGSWHSSDEQVDTSRIPNTALQRG